LYLYYGRIKISGLENVPQNKPVLFLPNHQAALMDVLLIVTDCRRKPFFLTRSDVFVNPTLKQFFSYLRMLPIYRIRDGRESLKKNQAVFDRCAQLFRENHAIVLFPEANHNIKRRVRPLSKGFTRILFNALEKNPEQDIHLVPVGLNYVKNDGFPDRVALNYGKSIVVNRLYEPKDLKSSIDRIKKAVSDRLLVLTTHISDEKNYDILSKKLDALQVDYLDPSKTNAVLKSLENSEVKDLKIADGENFRFPRPSRLPTFDNPTQVRDGSLDSPCPIVPKTLFKWIFILLNLPVIALWQIEIKPRVWEPEFTSTLRFGYGLLVYPICYLILFVVLATVWNGVTALAVVVAFFLFNWIYVKWG
jgi:1-acyl-sn-glycerol-3-phosphate acyltransferase